MPTIEQYSNCTYTLRNLGKAYPRTCAECGLGPCKTRPAPAVPKSAIEVELEALKARNAELEAMLSAVGAGGVGDAIKPAPVAQAEPAGIVSHAVTNDVIWRTWPKDLPDGTKLCIQPAQDADSLTAPILATDEITSAIEAMVDQQLVASAMEPGDMFRQDGSRIWDAAIAAIQAKGGEAS